MNLVRQSQSHIYNILEWGCNMFKLWFKLVVMPLCIRWGYYANTQCCYSHLIFLLKYKNNSRRKQQQNNRKKDLFERRGKYDWWVFCGLFARNWSRPKTTFNSKHFYGKVARYCVERTRLLLNTLSIFSTGHNSNIESIFMPKSCSFLCVSVPMLACHFACFIWL